MAEKDEREQQLKNQRITEGGKDLVQFNEERNQNRQDNHKKHAYVFF
jgi:hypothetical protein